MSKFVDGIAKTSLLYCTDCDGDIKKGEVVVFELVGQGKRMKRCYCEQCGAKFDLEVIEDSEHPFSSEELGQE